MELRALTGTGARDHEADGLVMARGFTNSLIAGKRGIRLWAGPANDNFYSDYTVLVAVGTALATGAKVDLSAWRPDGAINRFANNQIHAIVLEVLDEVFGPVERIGVRATTALATDSGGWRTINRFGQPLMVLLYPGSEDEHNQSEPADDLTSDGDRIAKMVASVVAAHGTAEDPEAYGQTIAELLLPDVLPYRIGTPACFGFAGRNGRALTDNVADVMCSLLTNSAFSMGLGKPDATGTVVKQFPYVVAAAGQRFIEPQEPTTEPKSRTGSQSQPIEAPR